MEINETIKVEQLSPDIRFAEAVTKWSSHLCRFAADTKKTYMSIAHRFEAFAPEYLGNLTLEHFERYIGHVLNRSSPQTANIHLMALRSFAKWLALHDIACPVTKMKKMRENPANPRLLSEDEYKAIVAVCRPAEADVIRFIAHTGLRRHELMSLRWSNISRDFKYIVIVGKGRKERTIPLNDTCREILGISECEDAHPLRFLRGRRHNDALYRLCERLAKRAGIRKFGPHALRHYCLTQLYRRGVPLHFISKIAGHADTRTTELIYCHIFGPTDLLGLTDVLDMNQEGHCPVHHSTIFPDIAGKLDDPMCFD